MEQDFVLCGCLKTLVRNVFWFKTTDELFKNFALVSGLR